MAIVGIKCHKEKEKKEIPDQEGTSRMPPQILDQSHLMISNIRISFLLCESELEK